MGGRGGAYSDWGGCGFWEVTLISLFISFSKIVYSDCGMSIFDPCTSSTCCTLTSLFTLTSSTLPHLHHLHLPHLHHLHLPHLQSFTPPTPTPSTLSHLHHLHSHTYNHIHLPHTYTSKLYTITPPTPTPSTPYLPHSDTFLNHQVSFADFCSDPNVLQNPNLIIRIDGK